MTGQEYANLLRTNEQVITLMLHPGWETLIEWLSKKAKEERVNVEDALDVVLVTDSEMARANYLDFKTKFLAIEQAAGIFQEIRQAAGTAKQTVETQGTEALEYL